MLPEVWDGSLGAGDFLPARAAHTATGGTGAPPAPGSRKAYSTSRGQLSRVMTSCSCAARCSWALAPPAVEVRNKRGNRYSALGHMPGS